VKYSWLGEKGSGRTGVKETALGWWEASDTSCLPEVDLLVMRHLQACKLSTHAADVSIPFNPTQALPTRAMNSQGTSIEAG